MSRPINQRKITTTKTIDGRKTMKTTTILAAALVGALALPNAHAQEFIPDQLQQRTLERRAVETAIWGMPSGRPATSPAKKQTNQSGAERTRS
jgi:hypothetical protein